MSAKVQIIERDGQPEYAVVPYSDYEELQRLADAMRDIQDYDAAMADPASRPGFRCAPSRYGLRE